MLDEEVTGMGNLDGMIEVVEWVIAVVVVFLHDYQKLIECIPIDLVDIGEVAQVKEGPHDSDSFGRVIRRETECRELPFR